MSAFDRNRATVRNYLALPFGLGTAVLTIPMLANAVFVVPGSGLQALGDYQRGEDYTQALQEVGEGLAIIAVWAALLQVTLAISGRDTKERNLD